MAKLELSSVLSELRRELKEAQEESRNEDLRFNVNNVEIELQTVLEAEGEGKVGGKIKFWVVDIDAEGTGTIKKGNTHTIRLNLGITDEKDIDSGTGEARRAKISSRRRY